MKKHFVLLMLSILTLKAYSQSEDSLFIRSIADEILLHGKAYDDLKVLTKQIGGRLAGSPQMVKAENWGLQLMQSLHPDKSWLQECMVPHWVRGGKDVAVATYGNDKKTHLTKNLDVIALGNSFGTGGKNLSAEVIEIKNFDDLEAKKDQLKNKIVFYSYPFNKRFIKTFMAYGDAVKYRGAGPSRAARYGAVGVIVRSMSESTDNYPHTGATNYNDSFPKIAAVAVGLQDADWLSEALQAGPVSVSMKTNGHFLPDTIGHNVIAELRGSEFPDEYITIGGHLDSWDPAEGAHDDGTGVVQTIEILRVFKTLGYHPKHTIRFVLFANEENGTRGGKKYAEEAKAKGEKHIFALESDEGGFTPRGFGFTGPDNQYKKIVNWSANLLAQYGATEVARGGGGSDIESLSATQNTPLGSIMPDSQRYFDIHHTRNDVFENVNKRELELGAVNIAGLIYLIDKYGL